MDSTATTLQREVVDRGTCIGCGACAATDSSSGTRMVPTPDGPVPSFTTQTALPKNILQACPGRGIDYPRLYEDHYRGAPANWLLGHVLHARTGYSATPGIRARSASGGVLTQVLIHLLETGRVDAVAAVQQGVPTPREARVILARTREEIERCAQSVYIPVSTLDILKSFQPGERYAITCLPDQSAALRRLQHDGVEQANQVAYVVGPYTGTQLMPAAIDCFLRSRGVPPGEDIVRLQWRAGDWPGYLEIETDSGRVLRSKKVYYNFLIPFFATRGCRQTMDFANEFADLSVGDAWSPKLENAGGGHSVILTRSSEMESVIDSLCRDKTLIAEEIAPQLASDMHGHMIDFKKRGSYIRNRWRRSFGMAAPDFGIRPEPLPLSRYLTECVISGLFTACGNRFARWCVTLVPERVIGPVFNWARLVWKRVSRPTKRKGLAALRMIPEKTS